MESRNLSLAEEEAFYFSMADAFVKRKGPILPLQKVVDSYPQYLLSLKNGHPNEALANSLLDSLGKLKKFWEKEVNNEILQKIMDDIKNGGAQQAKSLDEVDTVWIDTMKENVLLRIIPQKTTQTVPDLFVTRKRSLMDDLGPAKKTKYSKAEYLAIIIKVAAQIDSLNKTKEIDASDANEYKNRQEYLRNILHEFILSSNLAKDFQNIIDTLEACSDVINKIPARFKYANLISYLKMNIALALIEKTKSVDDYPLDAYTADLDHALALILSIDPASRDQSYNLVLARLERIILENSRDITDNLLTKLDDENLRVEDKIKACDTIIIRIYGELAHYERILNTGLAIAKDEQDLMLVSKSNLISALEIKAETLIESVPLENYSVEKLGLYIAVYESAINTYNEIVKTQASIGQNKEKYPVLLASALNAKGGMLLKATQLYLDEIGQITLTADQQVDRYNTALKLHQEASSAFTESLRAFQVLTKEQIVEHTDSLRKTEYNLTNTLQRMGYIYASMAALEPDNALTHLQNAEKCYKKAVEITADIDEATAQKDGHDINVGPYDYAVLLQKLGIAYEEKNNPQQAKISYETAINIMCSLPVEKQNAEMLIACKNSLDIINSKSNPPSPTRRSSV